LAETGTWNKAHGAEAFGFSGLKALHWNYLEPQLVEESIARGEAKLSAGGPLVAETGQHTGRSPKDKFVVRTPSVEDTIWWDNNKPMAPEAFDRLHADMLAHMQGRDFFVQDLFGGADPAGSGPDGAHG
jgi:phosphoenolpyruvate carboxykinase (ATP)